MFFSIQSASSKQPLPLSLPLCSESRCCSASRKHAAVRKPRKKNGKSAACGALSSAQFSRATFHQREKLVNLTDFQYISGCQVEHTENTAGDAQLDQIADAPGELFDA
jgi:hypothetical protein